MTALYLRKLTVRSFNSERSEPREAPNAWRVIARCERADVASCILTQQLGLLADQFLSSAISGLLRLIEVAATGNPLESMYDKKRCHWCHEFRHQGRKQRIFRIRAGDTRIVFVYGPNREICICSLMTKKKDNFSRSELLEFERVATVFLDALGAGRSVFVS